MGRYRKHPECITALKQILNPVGDSGDGAAATNATTNMDEQWKGIVAAELASLEKSQPQIKQVTFTLKGFAGSIVIKLI